VKLRSFDRFRLKFSLFAKSYDKNACSQLGKHILPVLVTNVSNYQTTNEVSVEEEEEVEVKNEYT